MCWIDIVFDEHLQLDFILLESASKFLKVISKVFLIKIITCLMYPYHYTFKLDLMKEEPQISSHIKKSFAMSLLVKFCSYLYRSVKIEQTYENLIISAKRKMGCTERRRSHKLNLMGTCTHCSRPFGALTLATHSRF